MKKAKLVPFILIIIGTIGLLIVELLGGSVGGFSRSLVLVFAVFNLLGLVVLALSQRN